MPSSGICQVPTARRATKLLRQLHPCIYSYLHPHLLSRLKRLPRPLPGLRSYGRVLTPSSRPLRAAPRGAWPHPVHRLLRTSISSKPATPLLQCYIPQPLVSYRAVAASSHKTHGQSCGTTAQGWSTTRRLAQKRLLQTQSGRMCGRVCGRVSGRLESPVIDCPCREF